MKPLRIEVIVCEGSAVLTHITFDILYNLGPKINSDSVPIHCNLNTIAFVYMADYILVRGDVKIVSL